MHGMHARLPKNFVLEERLERYRDQIELEPTRWRGRWAESAAAIGAPPFSSVRVDVGCGKGAFLVEAARREPEVLFVGIDAEPLCVAYTAQHVAEAGLRNALVVAGKGEVVPDAFAQGEVERIYLNFPTPYPRKKEASKRLVSLARLLDYRLVLAPAGEVRLRTDSVPLREYALTQFDLAGYDITYATDDERQELPDEPTSEYELRLAAQGATVLGLWATPSREPATSIPDFSLSLVDYLPDDLFQGAYVPHGMGGTIVNLRNRAIRRR